MTLSLNNSILYSEDGNNWESVLIPDVDSLEYYIAYDNNIWIASGVLTNRNSVILYSKDGKKWEKADVPTEVRSIENIVFDNNVYIAIGTTNGNSVILYSKDGKKWENANVSGISFTGVYIGYNNMWIAYTNDDSVLYSKNGKKWEKVVYN